MPGELPEEVIELGSDGCFDIPSTPAMPVIPPASTQKRQPSPTTPQADAVRKDQQPKPSSPSNGSTQSPRAPLEEAGTSVSLSASKKECQSHATGASYEVFEVEHDGRVIIEVDAHLPGLPADPSAVSVRVSCTHMLLRAKGVDAQCSVKLPREVDPTTAVARVRVDGCTVTMSLLEAPAPE